MTAPAVVEKVETPVVTDDAAAKAVADKAAADKAAADQAAADKIVADKVAADAAKAEKLTAVKAALKLPDQSTLDPALTERTAAILSELGLEPEAAQTAFAHLAKEATTHADARVAALLKANEPGGDAFKAQQEQYKKDLTAHPKFGAGKPEQYDANRGLVTRTVATLAVNAGLTPEEAKTVEMTGFLSHPLAARLFLAVGQGMKEDQFVTPGSGTAPLSREQRLDRMYPSMKKKD